jgi:hypothetical protein
MMQTRTAFPSAGAHQPSLVERFGRNRFALGGLALAVIAAGLAWPWSWLVAVGVAPLLLSVAPCAVMCALGVSLMGKSRGSRQATSAETSVASSNPAHLVGPDR